MGGKLAVLINAELHNELVLRVGTAGDVTGYIEHAIESFLERTQGDAHLWNSSYIDRFISENSDPFQKDYGDPKKGYHWSVLFLPNGTRLKMEYKGKEYFAFVKNSSIYYENEYFSPSEWARRIANNTSRNAWRDIHVQFNGEKEWILSDVLRHRVREVSP